MTHCHFLSLHTLSPDELTGILALAEKLKRELKAGIEHRVLRGKSLAMLFLQPSNRTRLSFEVGMTQLGGSAVNIRPDEIQLAKREPIPDVARVMSRYVDAVMMRVVKHDTIEEFAASATVPVINGLSDRYHPCQAASDMLTIREKKGRLAGLRLCYIGDGNNVCVSLMHACSLLGLQMVVGCPKGYEPIFEHGFSCDVVNNAAEAISGADIVYTDVWTSMGQEDESERRRRQFKSYTITTELFDRAAPDAIFMHCLPAHRGEEVTHEVVEHPRSVVFDQAENRLHVQKAILMSLLNAA